MIDFIVDNGSYFLTLGFDDRIRKPFRIVPVTQQEAVEISKTFNEEWADVIASGNEPWTLNDFKVTNAPDHPYAWTDSSLRVILHFKEQRWHMTPSEIAHIGKLANRAINLNA